jgi:hypothetical protein
MAVGVASPKAHGQAITSTDTKIVSEKTRDWPEMNHKRAATTAIAITVGTKYPEITSASLAIGALEPWASSTSLII